MANAFGFVFDTNKDGSSQKSGLTVSNASELEIRNLLKQVELQVSNKKLKWEKQKQESEHKLRLKEQELRQLETTIQEKDAQIEHLKSLLDDMDHTTQKIIGKFQQEMKALEEELSRVRLEYTVIQKKYKKATSRSGAPQPEPGDAGRNDVEVPRHLSSQLNYGSKCRHFIDVDINNNGIESAMNRHQFVTNHKNASMQRRTGESPSNNVSAQNAGLKRQGSVSKLTQQQMPSTPTSNLMQIQQEEIAQLKAQLEEQKRLGSQLNDEKDKAIKHVEHYKTLYMDVARKFESQNSPPSHPVQPDSNEKFNLSFLRQELVTREAQIKDLKLTNKAGSVELQFLKDEVKKYQKQTDQFTIEIEKLKRDKTETLKRFDFLELENQQLKTREKANEESLKAVELHRKKWELEKNNMIQELNILRHEINNYAEEITEKANKIRVLTDRTLSLEKAVEEGKVKYDKVNHELTMTIAQLESLRIENHFLKQSKTNEKDVVDLRKNFEQSEKENKRLRNEVIGLTKRLEVLKSQENVPGRRSHNSQADIQFELLKDENERKLETQRQRFESEIKRLNFEMDKMKNENNFLAAELENCRNHLVHLESDEKIQEKLISFDSRLSPSTLSSEMVRMSSASYNSNNHHDALFQENLSGHQRHLKSQSSSATKSSTAHLRSVYNLKDHHADHSPNRVANHSLGGEFKRLPTKSVNLDFKFSRNPNDFKKQKRLLENEYNDDIEKIRGSNE